MDRDDYLLESLGCCLLILLATVLPLALSWLANHLRGDWW